MRARLFTAAVLLSAIVAGSAPAPASDTKSIYDTLVAMKEHTVLSVGVREAEEIGPLKGQEKYTLFAPTDAAFKNLDDATIKNLATDKAAVKRFVRTHLVMGKMTAEDLKSDGKGIRTLQGSALKVEETKDGLRIAGAKIVTANIQCSNGVIHVIDTVLPVAKE